MSRPWRYLDFSDYETAEDVASLLVDLTSLADTVRDTVEYISRREGNPLESLSRATATLAQVYVRMNLSKSWLDLANMSVREQETASCIASEILKNKAYLDTIKELESQIVTLKEELTLKNKGKKK